MHEIKEHFSFQKEYNSAFNYSRNFPQLVSQKIYETNSLYVFLKKTLLNLNLINKWYIRHDK